MGLFEMFARMLTARCLQIEELLSYQTKYSAPVSVPVFRVTRCTLYILLMFRDCPLSSVSSTGVFTLTLKLLEKNLCSAVCEYAV
ncbi:hypothetical protein FVB9532_03242 [Mesonia oceanica]|uniref:Uncharacterized protein n=1 Tax=Mesonia oceanica TaxID=2687242 RepID=A0AC61YBT3_9FLAO|nr:hypothetical protein FVB9532_03242 [Mesonia oceanica]